MGEFWEGASAVQIGTAVVTRGLDLFRDVTTGIARFLELRGSSSLSEIVGVAARHGPSED